MAFPILRVMMMRAVVLWTLVLCVAGCGKKDPSGLESAEGPGPGYMSPPPPNTAVALACLKVAARANLCEPQIARELTAELIRHAPPLSDPHLKGAMLRMQRFTFRSWFRHTAPQQVAALMGEKGSFCRFGAGDKNGRLLSRSFRSCAKHKACDPLARCLVKQGAFALLMDGLKKQTRETRAAPKPPLNLAYHWSNLAGLSAFSVGMACSCPHWIARAARSVGKKPPPPGANKRGKSFCLRMIQRPLQCADALWAEAVSRNQASGAAAGNKTDTSIDPVEARRRLTLITNKLKSSLSTLLDPKTSCKVDQLKKTPADVRRLFLLILSCASEKTCKGYAACTRRAVDMP